jgi:hypothetical protein
MVGAVSTLNNIVTILNYLAGNSEKAKTGIIGLILEFNPFLKLNKELINAYQLLADAIRGNEKALEDNAAAAEASKKLGIELVKVVDAEGRVSYEFKKIAQEAEIITEELIIQAGAIETVQKQIKALTEQLPKLSEEELPAAELALYNFNQELKRLLGLGTQTPDIILKPIENIDALIESINKIRYPDTDKLEDGRDAEIQITAETSDAKLDIYYAFAEQVQGIYNSLAQMSLQNMNAELAAAEGNEKKQEEIRRKYAKREQAFAIGQAWISGSLAILKIAERWAGTPVQIALTVLQGIQTALQIATIKAQKFATGILDLKGRGTGTSDEIPAMLSRGESVMTAKETHEFYPYLKAMKEGKFPKLQLELMKDFAGITNNNLNYDNSKEIRELREIRKALKRDHSETIEGKYKVIRRGGITTKISLN